MSSPQHNNPAQKRMSRLTIIAVLIAAVAAIRIFSQDFFGLHLPARWQDLVTLAISVLIESLPFVIVGIVLSIVVQIWLPDQFLMRRLPKNGFLRRVCISLLGVFLPVCECGNVPLTRGLLLQGMTVAESLVFLLAAPIVNPVTILTTYQAFGHDPVIVICRIFGGFFIANLIGWLYSKHPDQHSLLTSGFSQQCSLDHEHKHEHSESKLKQSIDIFVHETSNVLPALFIGAIVAASIQVVVPRSTLLTLGSNPAWSIVAMMVLAFVISICSNVDAFFALAFSHTFTAGSLVSFLVFGPVIDIKMLVLMKTTYTLKVLIQITVLIALLTAAMGLVINYVF